MMRIYDTMMEVLVGLRPVVAAIEGYDRDLARQMRRAASSVVLNTAEGSGSHGGRGGSGIQECAWVGSGDGGVSRCGGGVWVCRAGRCGASGPAGQGAGDAGEGGSVTRDERTARRVVGARSYRGYAATRTRVPMTRFMVGRRLSGMEST